MNFENFGEHKIYRPTLSVEHEIRKVIEGALFQEYHSKVYTQYDEINAIIQKVLKLYSEILEVNINKLASLHFMEFILDQYDVTCRINRAIDLNSNEQDRWRVLGPILRRGLKFIAEKITMLDPGESPEITDEEEIDRIISIIFIAAEEMVSLYMQSDSTYRIFRNETQLTLRKGHDIYWELKINNDFVRQFP